MNEEEEVVRAVRAEVEKIYAIAQPAIIRGFNTRRGIEPNWSGAVRDNYEGAVSVPEDITKDASNFHPGELESVVRHVRGHLHAWISLAVSFKSPRWFDKGMESARHNNPLGRTPVEARQKLLIEGRLLIAGLEAAKTAYMKLHPEFTPPPTGRDL